MHLDRRIKFWATNVGAVVMTLFLTYISVAYKNGIVLPAVGGLLMLVICFLSVKTALAILIMSMLLSPEITVASNEKHDITIRFDDMLLLIITVGWILRMAILKDIGFMRKNPLNKAIVSFCFLALLSTLFGIFRGNINWLPGTFFVLKVVEYFFLFYMVVNFVETPKDIYLFIRLLLLVCGIVCVYALSQLVVYHDISLPFEGARRERNTLGGYLMLIATVACGTLFYRDKGKKPYTLIVLLMGIIVTLLFSLSRSGWSGFIISFMALFIIVKWFKLFIIIMLCLAPLLPVLIPREVKQRFEYTYSEEYAAHRMQVKILGVRLDGSSSARLRSYGLVLAEIPKHLFFGYGITGFAFVDGQFFRILSEMGVLGLGVFIWLLTAVYRLILKTKQLEIPDTFRGMIVGFQAAFWGIIMHAMTANTFLIIRIAEPFWFFTGLIAVIYLHYGGRTGIGSLESNGRINPVAVRATSELMNKTVTGAVV
jgi:hypothetical protein